MKPTPILAPLLIAGLAGLMSSSAQAQDAEPIQILIDVHADPMTQCPPDCAIDLADQTARYLEWVDRLDWVLDQTAPFGAKVSFLSGGDFMEWVLEPPAGLVPPAALNPGPEVVTRLYASGGQVGTHSHKENRFGPHDWRQLEVVPPPTEADADQHWSDHVGMVDAVVTEVLGVTDPADVRAINASRGSGVPSDHPGRMERMEAYGFSIHQQGTDQEFYGYFGHYVMNPWRPARDRVLSEDESGPVVLAPTGSVIGKIGVHFGIEQDNHLERMQSRFLMEILNWLHDRRVAATDRIWTFGWGSHPTDYAAGQPSHDALVPMLAWLSNHFVGRDLGGNLAARFSTFIETRDLFQAWEATHPGTSSFRYPATDTDWSAYPYLIPAHVYLAQGEYAGPRPPVGRVRWHAVDAPASAGGPFRFHVAFVEGSLGTSVDLSAFLPPGPIAVVDPVTGDSVNHPTTAVPIPPAGALLVPPANVVPICSGTSDPDYPALGTACFAGIGECRRAGIVVCRDDMRGIECNAVPGSPLPEVCDALDNDCDGSIDEDPPAGDVDTRVDRGELRWLPVPAATAYDVAWGSLAVLRSTGGDFTAAARPCLANDVPTTRVGIPPDPGVWYLVRPVNCAGSGTYGTAERDAEIDAAPSACP